MSSSPATMAEARDHIPESSDRRWSFIAGQTRPGPAESTRDRRERLNVVGYILTRDPAHRGLRPHRRYADRGAGGHRRLYRLAVPAPLRLRGLLRVATGHA